MQGKAPRICCYDHLNHGNQFNYIGSLPLAWDTISFPIIILFFFFLHSLGLGAGEAGPYGNIMVKNVNDYGSSWTLCGKVY
jgi:hypothetical protein